MATFNPSSNIRVRPIRMTKARRYPIPDIEGPRWHLVDRRRVKADIKTAAKRVHKTRVLYKLKQRELSAANAANDEDAQLAISGQELPELAEKLEHAKQRSRSLTLFASWLNARRKTVPISHQELHGLLEHYKIEAITALAALVSDDEDDA